jgi:hypothetical protein
VTGTSETTGMTDSEVCVGITVGAGGEVGEAPPSGVGVAYCPHRDAFPPHADAVSRNEAAIKKLIGRFTD